MTSLGPIELATIGVGVLTVVGAIIALLSRRRGRRSLAMVEVDEVGRLKELADQLAEVEQELVAAGQSLGRVRRFLSEQGPADEITADLKDALAGVWLRRHDVQGRLRLAALRRRVPVPPEGHRLVTPTDVHGASDVATELVELATAYRLLASRAEDSARMLRQMLPADDVNARWVGDAVEAAEAWRAAQVEDILRFAGRMGLLATRLEEAGVVVEGVLTALGADDGLEEDLAPLDSERAHGLIRLGLEDRRARELTEDGRVEADLEEAMERGRKLVSDARELARRAATRGGPRSA